MVTKFGKFAEELMSSGDLSNDDKKLLDRKFKFVLNFNSDYNHTSQETGGMFQTKFVVPIPKPGTGAFEIEPTKSFKKGKTHEFYEGTEGVKKVSYGGNSFRLPSIEEIELARLIGDTGDEFPENLEDPTIEYTSPEINQSGEVFKIIFELVKPNRGGGYRKRKSKRRRSKRRKSRKRKSKTHRRRR